MLRGRQSQRRAGSFLADARGQNLVEYALLGAFLGGSVLAGYASVGGRLPPLFWDGRVDKEQVRPEPPPAPPLSPAEPPLSEVPPEPVPAPEVPAPVPEPPAPVIPPPPLPLAYIGPTTIAVAEDTAEIVPLDARGGTGSYACGLQGEMGTRQADGSVIYAVAPGVRVTSRAGEPVPCALESDLIAAETKQDVRVVIADTKDKTNTVTTTITLRIGGCVKPGNGQGHGWGVCKTKPDPDCEPPGNGGGYAHGVCWNDVDEGGKSGR